MCPIDFEDDLPSSEPPTANHEAEDDDWLADELATLAAVPDLSELERQVFIARMGWGKEGVKTYDEIAKQFKLTIAEARSIEKDVRRPFLIQKQCFKPKRFHIAPPAVGTLSPRDGDTIKQTSDMLFLAKYKTRIKSAADRGSKVSHL